MPARIVRSAAFILVASVGASPLAAQQRAVETDARGRPSPAALSALVDSAVTAALLSRGVPSVSVVVARGDETLVQRAWGKADVASGRAAEASTVYALGSNSKQFTAALVLRLVDRGRLSLGDPLGRHLPGIRPDWAAITIEQLLNHTSGLQRGGFVVMSRITEAVSFDSIIARAARDSMAAPPGTTHLYSNTGYVILGALVERLYGKTYAAALRDEIAQPLGLATLRYCGDVEASTRATGYRRSPGDGTLSSAPALHPSQQLGASGVCSTAADLAKWNRALHGGRVLSAASYKAMITPRGVAQSYGLGLSVGRVPWGDSIIAHGGQEVSGFVSENAWYPADSLSVTILYNAYPRVPSGGTHVIAALALGRRPPAAPSQAPPPAVAPTPGGEKGALAHQSGASYRVENDSRTTVTFLADADGRVVGFLAQPSGSPERRLRKGR